MHKLRKESICHPGAGEKLIFNFPNDTPFLLFLRFCLIAWKLHQREMQMILDYSLAAVIYLTSSFSLSCTHTPTHIHKHTHPSTQLKLHLGSSGEAVDKIHSPFANWHSIEILFAAASITIRIYGHSQRGAATPTHSSLPTTAALIANLLTAINVSTAWSCHIKMSLSSGLKIQSVCSADYSITHAS